MMPSKQGFCGGRAREGESEQRCQQIFAAAALGNRICGLSPRVRPLQCLASLPVCVATHAQPQTR
jgi:hypothetical protein